MRLTRVHVEGPLEPGSSFAITGEAANHISRVLRLRVGDSLTLFDGRGGEYAATIEAFRKDIVLAQVLEHRHVARESPLNLTLAQGISRGERMDLVIQKATELGAQRIVPVFTSRSVVRLNASQAEKKLQHWQRVAIAACEQSGRDRVPEVAEPVNFYEFLGQPAGGLRLVLSPSATRRLSDFTASPRDITVLVGPEGGLTEDEQDAAERAGFERLNLGPRILRTETAALVALAVLQERFGDL